MRSYVAGNIIIELISSHTYTIKIHLSYVVITSYVQLIEQKKYEGPYSSGNKIVIGSIRECRLSIPHSTAEPRRNERSSGGVSERNLVRG